MAVLEAIYDSGKYKVAFDESSGEVKLYRHGEIWDGFPKYSKMFITIVYDVFKYEKTISKFEEEIKTLKEEVKNRDGIIEYLEGHVKFCKCGNPKNDCICL